MSTLQLGSKNTINLELFQINFRTHTHAQLLSRIKVLIYWSLSTIPFIESSELLIIFGTTESNMSIKTLISHVKNTQN